MYSVFFFLFYFDKKLWFIPRVEYFEIKRHKQSMLDGGYFYLKLFCRYGCLSDKVTLITTPSRPYAISLLNGCWQSSFTFSHTTSDSPALNARSRAALPFFFPRASSSVMRDDLATMDCSSQSSASFFHPMTSRVPVKLFVMLIERIPAGRANWNKGTAWNIANKSINQSINRTVYQQSTIFTWRTTDSCWDPAATPSQPSPVKTFSAG